MTETRASCSASADGHVRQPAVHLPIVRPCWKSAKSAAVAISIGSSSCPGGSTPKIRTGCRRCCWKSRSFSTAASIRSISTATPTQFIAVRGGETVGRILVSDDPPLQPAARRERGLLRHVRVRRRPADGPRPAGRGRRLAPRPRPDGDPRPDRLLDQLSLRPADRRLRHAAADHDEPQPPLLRRLAGIVGPAQRPRTSMHGGSSIRWTWCRSGRPGPSGWPGAAASPSAPSAPTTSPPRWPAARRSTTPSMRDLWGFVKLTDAEFHYLAKRLAKLAVAEQVLLAEVDGQPVGFSITLPDINEAIRPLNGRLTSFGLPMGLLRFLRRKRHIKTARMVVLDVLEGVSPPRHRRTADPPHARLRQERDRLHRRGTGLDPGGQSTPSTARSRPSAADATKPTGCTKRDSSSHRLSVFVVGDSPNAQTCGHPPDVVVAVHMPPSFRTAELPTDN